MNYKTFDIFQGKKAVKSFEPQEMIPESFCGLIVGKPGSGKSTLIKMMLHDPHAFGKKFDLVLFLAPYPISDLDLKEDRLHNTLDLPWIYERIEYFKQFKKVGKVLVIIDDLIAGVKQSSNDAGLAELFFNRRKIVPGTEISLLLTTQKYNVFPLKFRSNLQFIIIFNIPNRDFQDVSKEQFYNPRKDLTSLINAHFATYDHNFIYIRLQPYQIFLNFTKPI